MRLPKPFYRLPLRFDAERLRSEVADLPASAWAKHPNEIAGNSSVRLISVEGGENDDVNGRMAPTAHLRQSPYLRQALASFGVVWSRSRLLRLAPGATVPEHADINYHWFNRVRLHIPIVTRPQVRFYCADQSVHMAAGEAWIFDNWRPHRVENFTEHERIHLVADTSGSATFWRLVAQGEGSAVREVPYAPGRDATPLTERTQLAPVMAPAEVDLLVMDLLAELMPQDASIDRARLARYHGLLDALCRDWRQLYALYGDAPEGWPEFTKLRDSVRAASRDLAEGLVMRTNRVGVHAVLEGRLLRAMLSVPAVATMGGHASTQGSAQVATQGSSQVTAHVSTRRTRIKSPIFIVAAPRSGSTLLFETLAASSQLCTVGGEAHWLIESIPELRPGAAGVESNRLTEQHVTQFIADNIEQQILARLKDCRGTALEQSGGRRFLEKTPKNSLRIPFFERIFPDAQFIWLWRDPRPNIASIIEAWHSGQWQTYGRLEGFDGPWSLLLPPGWRAMNGRPLPEIAAWQWQQANQFILDDLARLPRGRWSMVGYEDLIRDPAAAIGRLCKFLKLDVDHELAARLQEPLPHSRYTLKAPDPEKWREHEAEIMRVLPSAQALWDRLRAIYSSNL